MTTIKSELLGRSKPGRKQKAGRRHRLSLCDATGLARYRDRHQAKQAAEQATSGRCAYRITTYSCPACRGFHLERVTTSSCQSPTSIDKPVGPSSYVLVDVENWTGGARLNRDELLQLWTTIRIKLGVTGHDQVLVGAAVRVSRRRDYRSVINGNNVSWVVGAQATDGADRALLAATNLTQIAARFERLIIISGDHAFADLARQARNRGLDVHVVTTPQHGQSTTLSRALARYATTHTEVSIARATPRAA